MIKLLVFTLLTVGVIEEVSCIVHGRPANIREAKFTLNIEINAYKDGATKRNIFGCGGIIIGPKVILTAGHCLDVQERNAKITVYGGLTNINEGNAPGVQERYVTSWELHPKYDGHEVVYDLAMAFLNSPFVFSRTGKIEEAKIYDVNDIIRTNTVGTIYGWGDTEDCKDSEYLRKAELAITPNTRQTGRRIDKTAICAKSTERDLIRKAISCDGDSGGPFVVNGKVLGLISGGAHHTGAFGGKYNCTCYPDDTDYYVRLPYFEEWIRKTRDKPVLAKRPR